MKPRKPLSENMLEIIAQRFRVLSDPLRLNILQRLGDQERSVGELVVATGANQANVSKHLQILFRAGYLNRRKDGLQVFYQVTDSSIFEMCEIVCGSVANQLQATLDVVRGDENAE